MYPRFLALLVVLPGMAFPAGEPVAFNVADPSRDTFQAAKTVLADQKTTAGTKQRALRDLVMSDANEAPAVVASAVGDADRTVQEKAGEWLAMLGDERGLQLELECVRTRHCCQPHNAARLIGNAGRPQDAPILASAVRELLKKGVREDNLWRGTSEDQALLDNSALALARIGRPEDAELVLRAAAARSLRGGLVLESLGYLDDPRSKELLWASNNGADKVGATALAIEALLNLSRLGDALALTRLQGFLADRGTAQSRAATCGDREGLLDHLRPRDSAHFAEAVISLAGREPEGPCTKAAWRALGVMRPSGFGQRVLTLALSKRPHWNLVSRDLLHTVVIAVDPDLNEAFCSAFEVKIVPAMRGEKLLVGRGLGYLLFTGTAQWTGD